MLYPQRPCNNCGHYIGALEEYTQNTSLEYIHKDLQLCIKNLKEILDYMRNEYSSLSAKGCMLCVYEDGKFIRHCKLHEEMEYYKKKSDYVEINDNVISALLLEAADSDMGIYAMSVRGGDTPYEKRTERMEGWNEYALELGKKRCKFKDFLKSLSSDEFHAACFLLASDVLYLSERHEDIVPWLLMNDTFYYACGDGEDVNKEDLVLIVTLFKTWGHDGLNAWVANKRGQDVLKEYQTDNYFNALKYIKGE